MKRRGSELNEGNGEESAAPAPDAVASSTAVAVVKRTKVEDSTALVKVGAPASGTQAVVKAKIKRTSGLSHPIIRLTGHTGAVLTCRFDPSGERFATSSSDHTILLWKTYGDCPNYGILRGHTGPVLDVCWSPGGVQLYSASSDGMVGIWDAESGECVKKLKGHDRIVNSCSAKPRFAGHGVVVASGGDDGTIKLWDERQKHAAQEFENRWPVTSVCFSADGSIVYSGSIDNKITAWDVRADKPQYTLVGHSDTVTGIALAPTTGHYLASASMDNTVRLWDIRPFSTLPTRCEAVYIGAPHGFEKNLIRPCFSTDESMIASGSSDRTVVIWARRGGNIRYKLPGHTGTVNQVDWHPREPIVLSASADKTLFLGEVDPEL
ncbi:hypothetical protein EV182_003237 [Spiromyces aspiralis]|uniref:Uncharacterized protein n=1 Tax=Spiromyces aspiralis TaxID=68401 RepID=A0ACC1HQW6_9FUNG|nr:hypothetical protein EV182_003237 [Spiromyces aspiralis]